MAASSASQTPSPERGLEFIKAADLAFTKRPLGTVDVVDVNDTRVGRFDGLLLSHATRQPRYVVVRHGDERAMTWTAVPVGDAWFDDTSRVIRVDPNRSAPFDPEALERMSLADALEYELRLLADCCPEVTGHTKPIYETDRFECPPWLGGQ